VQKALEIKSAPDGPKAKLAGLRVLSLPRAPQRRVPRFLEDPNTAGSANGPSRDGRRKRLVERYLPSGHLDDRVENALDCAADEFRKVGRQLRHHWPNLSKGIARFQK
jgi:hypothetical protein